MAQSECGTYPSTATILQSVSPPSSCYIQCCVSCKGVVVDSPTPICFSTTPDHALPSSRFLMEHDRIDEDEADHYKTILEQRDTVNVNWESREPDGWVTSPSRHRLLFWVPRDFRERLLMPGQQLILGVEPLELDLSQFVHGPDWAKCYQA